MKFGALILLFVFLVSCGDDSEETPAKLQTEPSTELVALNTAAADAHADAMSVAELILGEGGVADLTQANRTLPMTTAAEIQAWRANRDLLRVRVDEANAQLSKFVLNARRMQLSREAFVGQQSMAFPFTPEGLSTRKQPLLLAALAVAALSIGAYRFLKAFGELADKSQRMVYSTAEGGDSGRMAVIQALRENGVTVPDSASAEDVINTFKELPRDVRRTVTTEVEEWNSDEFFSNDEQAANGASGRFEEARNDIPQISNDGGAFAVTQTVGLSQSVTGGIGGIQGGAPGAVADLALTALEMNPTDIVQRRVTVYATGGEKVDVPSETSPTSPTDAADVIQRAADGDPTVNPDQLQDAAVALTQEVTDALKLQFGPDVKLSDKVVITSSTLEEEKEDDGSFTLKNSLALPHFANGEKSDVIVAREGILPHEASSHELGPENPLKLTSIPLAGTMSVTSTGASTPREGVEVFTVNVSMTHVSEPTTLHCDGGANLQCSPASSTVAADTGTVSFNVEVSETAQMVLTRGDTGETYTKTFTATEVKEAEAETCFEAKTHMCVKLPQIDCNIAIMGTAKSRIIKACGAEAGQAYIAAAPGLCC